jgi:hypothetical protein
VSGRANVSATASAICSRTCERFRWRFLALFGAFREVFVADHQCAQKVKYQGRNFVYHRALQPVMVLD